MTDHRCDYLLWTATIRDTAAAGGLAYTFPVVETQVEQMVEAVLADSVAEPNLWRWGIAGDAIAQTVILTISQ